MLGVCLVIVQLVYVLNYTSIVSTSIRMAEYGSIAVEMSVRKRETATFVSNVLHHRLILLLFFRVLAVFKEGVRYDNSPVAATLLLLLLSY